MCKTKVALIPIEVFYFFDKHFNICAFNFLGSLASSIFEPFVPLVGASGGVYALFTAQLANVVLVRIRS